MQDALDTQEELRQLRPQLPTRAQVKDTELADKLVQHVDDYKAVIDTLRILLANIEADLAADLAEFLGRPREAKKALANLFAAPGTVRLRKRHVRVELAPAATADERQAFAALLEKINRQRLRLPGDPSRRPLQFTLKPQT